jgi:hypothetical protein
MRSRLMISLLVLTAIMAWGSGAQAAQAPASATKGTCITCLGAPTNALDEHFYLGDWKYIGVTPRQHGKPELLFIGDLLDPSAPERWPITKALDQFGSWSNVTPDTHPRYGGDNIIPTYNWLHARYHSHYIAFVAKALYDYNGRPFQRLSPSEAALYRRYVGRQPTGVGPQLQKYGSLPLVFLGGYLLRGPFNVVSEDDFYVYDATANSYKALSFDTVLHAMQQGSSPPNAVGLVYDINLEANIITALACHADGKQPRSVCQRPVIKRILQHVR